MVNPKRAKEPIPHLVVFGCSSKYLLYLYEATEYAIIVNTICKIILIKETVPNSSVLDLTIAFLPNISWKIRGEIIKTKGIIPNIFGSLFIKYYS
jgi:hypothetical protein